MKQNRGKPSKGLWAMCLGLILTGLLLLLPVFPEYLRERLPPVLVMSGFFALLVLWRRKEKYDDLSPEEQKELDREDRDERNQMIYEKTACHCWRGETALFFITYLAAALFWDIIPALRQIDYRIFSWILLIYWVRILIFGLVRWLLNRKY